MQRAPLRGDHDARRYAPKHRMSKVILKGFVVVPEDDLSAVLKELNNHIDFTREEPGCLIFEVTQDLGNPTRFDVYEEFIDIAAFENHQQRVERSEWGRVSANVERHYEISEQTQNE